MALERKTRQIGSSSHKVEKSAFWHFAQVSMQFSSCWRAGHGTACAKIPALHGSANPHPPTSAGWTAQKSCSHSTWLVFSMQASLSHSFVKFSPSSALLSNGNRSLDMVCTPPIRVRERWSEHLKTWQTHLIHPVFSSILLILHSKTR